jgi:hypothetical protein
VQSSPAPAEPFSASPEVSADSPGAAKATARHIRQALGQLPLYFVENQGQLDKRVVYYIQGSDKTLYFTPDGVTFALTERPLRATNDERRRDVGLPNLPPGRDDGRYPQQTEDSGTLQRWAVKLDFVGANPNARPIGQDKTEAIISYFKGQPDQWHAGLPTYASIIYPDL